MRHIEGGCFQRSRDGRSYVLPQLLSLKISVNWFNNPNKYNKHRALFSFKNTHNHIQLNFCKLILYQIVWAIVLTTIKPHSPLDDQLTVPLVCGVISHGTMNMAFHSNDKSDQYSIAQCTASAWPVQHCTVCSVSLTSTVLHSVQCQCRSRCLHYLQKANILIAQAMRTKHKWTYSLATTQTLVTWNPYNQTAHN